MQTNEAKLESTPIPKPPSELVPVLANPDQGPPVPPRKGQRRSTHIELIIPAWDDQIESMRIPKNLQDKIPKPRISPRRPPPSPPSPRRELESNKRSTIAVAKEKKTSVEPPETKRHSMFSTSLSTTQIHRISTNYEVCEFTLDFTDPPEPKAPRKPARFRLKNHGAEDTGRAVQSPVSERSKTPDTLFSESSTTGSSNDFEPKRESDSEAEASSTAMRRYTSSSKKIAPPKPPKYRGPDETTVVQSTDRSTPTSPRSCGLGEDSPPPLPSQPIPKRKDTTKKWSAPEAPVLREGSPLSQRSEEERLTSPPRRTHDHVYDYISDWLVPTQKDHRETSPKNPDTNFTKARSTDHYEDVELDFSARQETKSLMFRRSNSDRFKKHKISTLDPIITDDITKERLHRTPSLDKLNARIDRISSNAQESSDSDDEDMVVSPIQQGGSQDFYSDMHVAEQYV